MEWSNLRYDQDLAYQESLLQDILKQTTPKPEEPDKKLTMAELREKRIQAFSGKKTSTINNGHCLDSIYTYCRNVFGLFDRGFTQWRSTVDPGQLGHVSL